MYLITLLAVLPAIAGSNLSEAKWERVCDDAGYDTGGSPSTPFAGDLHRVVLDERAFPEAVCNDGSPASFYVAPAASRSNHWVVALQGGFACRSYDECLQRWCEQFDPSDPTQPFMTGEGLPDSIDGTGIMSKSSFNDFHDYNRVYVPYCSSDAWFGDAEVTWSDGGTDMVLEYRGQAIVQAVAETLAQGEWESVDGVTPSEDLADAEEILLAGTSAGGGGVAVQADRFFETIDATVHHQAQTHALVDAVFTPTLADPTVDALWLGDLLGFAALVNSGLDESCVAVNGFVEDCLRLDVLFGKPYVQTPAFLTVNACDPVLDRGARAIYGDAGVPWTAGRPWPWGAGGPIPGSTNTSTLIGQARRAGIDAVTQNNPAIGAWVRNQAPGLSEHVLISKWPFFNSYDTVIEQWTDGTPFVSLGTPVTECPEP